MNKEIFFETCLKPIQNIEPIKYINWLNKLKYTHCIIEIEEKEIKNEFNRETFFLRTTFTSKNKNPMTLQIDRLKSDLIFYYTSSPELTKWACQDQRIDGLQFDLGLINKLADRSTINLIKSNKKCIDINLTNFFKNNYTINLGHVRNLKKVIHESIKKEIPIILSSYAEFPSDLRSKKILIGVSKFIGMPKDYYEDISLTWLYKRVLRNRKRIDSKSDNFISPDVWKNSGEDI